MSMFVVLGRAERIDASSDDNNVGGDTVSTLKPGEEPCPASHRPDALRSARAAPLLLAAIAIGLLSACAPTHDWVGPGDGLGMRGADMSACHQEAALRSDRSTWFHRQRLQRDAWWARNASDRAMANARLHQLEMLSALDRQRAFDGCMQARGYRLQALPP
jgi:hypothetical protein